jgi:hypothetical protein
MGLEARRDGRPHRHFAGRRNQAAAKDRVAAVEGLVAREPDLIIGSWWARSSGLSALRRGPAFSKPIQRMREAGDLEPAP